MNRTLIASLGILALLGGVGGVSTELAAASSLINRTHQPVLRSPASTTAAVAPSAPQPLSSSTLRQSVPSITSRPPIPYDRGLDASSGETSYAGGGGGGGGGGSGTALDARSTVGQDPASDFGRGTAAAPTVFNEDGRSWEEDDTAPLGGPTQGYPSRRGQARVVAQAAPEQLVKQLEQQSKDLLDLKQQLEDKNRVITQIDLVLREFAKRSVQLDQAVASVAMGYNEAQAVLQATQAFLSAAPLPPSDPSITLQSILARVSGVIGKIPAEITALTTATKLLEATLSLDEAQRAELNQLLGLEIEASIAAPETQRRAAGLLVGRASGAAIEKAQSQSSPYFHPRSLRESSRYSSHATPRGADIGGGRVGPAAASSTAPIPAASDAAGGWMMSPQEVAALRSKSGH